MGTGPRPAALRAVVLTTRLRLRKTTSFSICSYFFKSTDSIVILRIFDKHAPASRKFSPHLKKAGLSKPREQFSGTKHLQMNCNLNFIEVGKEMNPCRGTV